MVPVFFSVYMVAGASIAYLRCGVVRHRFRVTFEQSVKYFRRSFVFTSLLNLDTNSVLRPLAACLIVRCFLARLDLLGIVVCILVETVDESV